MNVKGSYSNINYQENEVLKEIDFVSDFEKKIFMNTTDRGINFERQTSEYAKKIRKYGLMTPEIIEIGKKSGRYYIIQEYIHGIMLEELVINEVRALFDNNNSLNEKTIYTSLKYFRKLLLINKHLEDLDSNISLDNNKKNFLIDINDNIIYVDITPPLFKEKLKKINYQQIVGKKNKAVFKSYINRTDQLLSISFYWYKTLKSIKLYLTKEDNQRIFNCMIVIIDEIYGETVVSEIFSKIKNQINFFSKTLYGLLLRNY